MRSFGTSILARMLVCGASLVSITCALAETLPPQPLVNRAPTPPSNRFGFPTEGWVVVRYAILANGQTANVRAVDRQPPQLSDREAVAAVEAWTFEPATLDGAAIDWHNNESMIVYDVDSIAFEPSPFFLQAYSEADELNKAGDPDKALSRNKNMQTTVTSRLAEVGLAQVQSTAIHIALSDVHEAYAAIRSATDPRVAVLVPADLNIALQYRGALEIQLGDVVGALATFARRNEIAPVPESDPAVARMAALEEALGGDAPIGIKAKILDDYWMHAPSRRTFEIADVAGDVKGIRIECDRRVAELEYSPGSALTLPESWGACTVIVEGRSDTEFVFYEFK
jgi:TonB family protein